VLAKRKEKEKKKEDENKPRVKVRHRDRKNIGKRRKPAADSASSNKENAE